MISSRINGMLDLLGYGFSDSLLLSVVCIIGIVIALRAKLPHKADASTKPQKKIILAARIVATTICAAALAFCLSSIPGYIGDLMLVRHENYEYDTCVIVEQDISEPEELWATRAVKVKSLSGGEPYKLTLDYYALHKDETVRVVYLKHSKLGAVVEHISKADAKQS